LPLPGTAQMTTAGYPQNNQTAAMVAAQAAQNAVAAITAQQQFIINSFRGQIYISNQLDVEDTPVYDTVTYTAGQTVTLTNASWFTNVEGNSGKTFAQTNMDTNGRLDAPEAFSVFGVRFNWSEGILRSDLQTLLDSWAFEFWLGKKNYQRANIRHFSSGMGISGYTTKTAESFYTNGVPGRQSMNMLSVKLVIANQMSFEAFLSGNNSGQVLSSSGAGAILYVELVGLYARGVQ
jgi:hypothetical protein